MVKVGVNGYSTIGRRVADAIRLQPDLELVGVVKRTPDYSAFLAEEKGIQIFSADDPGRQKLESSGLKVHGTLRDLLGSCDVIVDASPEKGEENLELYKQAGVKAVFQGGEEHSIAGTSFVAQCNYSEAVGKRFVRVVSCNTTGLCRILKALDDSVGVDRAIVTLIRRATDPNDSKKGPIDSAVPDPVELPSHHAEDVRSVLPGINLTTMAVKVPTTHMHLHALAVKPRKADMDSVTESLSNCPRALFFESKKGYTATSSIMDYAREIGRPRGDLYEVGIWKESVKIQDGWLYLFIAIHQESIVIPENIDCIRAMTGTEDANSSMEMTDKTLGIVR
jgi:glyceraldehyde-3-phosphate dehydrogenase (NAD(P))